MRYSEENIFTMLGRIGQHAGVPVSGDRYRQVFIRESVWPNLCFDLRLDEVLIDHEIAQIRHRIAQHLSPPVCMFTPGILSEATFHRFERAASGYGSWTAMSLEIDPSRSYLIENKWIQTALVRSEAELQDWCRISNESLTGNASIHLQLFLRLLSDPDFSFYLARMDGEPVAAAMSFSSGSAAGLYLVSTIEKYRGNGFGATVTASAIEHLKLKGIKEIHLQATVSGQPVYSRLGFSREGKIHVFNLK